MFNALSHTTKAKYDLQKATVHLPPNILSFPFLFIVIIVKATNMMKFYYHLNKYVNKRYYDYSYIISGFKQAIIGNADQAHSYLY